jgi:NADH dehydrogenase
MDARPHVVIIGAGFGGLETARRLARAPVRITLIDRNNYHLFQPLLYQVAIAGLSPVEIAYPVRAILHRQANLSFLMGEVSGVDLAARTLTVGGESLAYDMLVVAVGGQTNFFGLRSVETNALQVKDIPSAVSMCNHLLEMFERASRAPDKDLLAKQLTFVVVGGGPTGVETAGALSELIRLVLAKDYPSLDLSAARVVLLEAGPCLMPAFPTHLQAATERMLRAKGVEVRLNVKVTGYDGERVSLADGPALVSGSLIWTAGMRVAGLVDRLWVLQAASGRARVEPSLQLPGHPEVYVLGDAAYFENGAGPLPMLATVALQEAASVGRNIDLQVKGRPALPFEYRDPGLLATIGRNAAVAYIGGVALQGFPAWVIWVGLHIFRIIGFRNRLVVMINWAWDYFFYYRAVRLITRE